MRNALVVLVPLCFGLTSGFIVPHGVQEISIDIKNDLNSIQSSASKSRNMLRMITKNNLEIYNISRINTTQKPVSPEKVNNDSLNIDIYEHSQPKDSDVQERSFIYLKQRSKKPIRQRLYDKLKQRQQFDGNNHQSYLLNINNIFDDLPRQFSIGYIGDSFNKMNAEISNKPDHRCHAKLRDDIEHKADEMSRVVSNEQREYLELLKAPILRPKASIIDKATSNVVPLNTQKGKSAYIILNSSENKKDNPVEFQKITHIGSTPQGFMKDNVRDEVFLINNPGHNAFYNTDDGDQLLLDDFTKQKIKDNEWRIGSHNLNHENIIFCRDCVKKARKHRLSSRLIIETMCKCGHHLIPRLVETIEQPS